MVFVRQLLLMLIRQQLHLIATNPTLVLIAVPGHWRSTDRLEAHLNAELVVPCLQPTHLLLNIFDFRECLRGLRQ